MGTRSIIAAKFDSVSSEGGYGIVGSYCHYDGYLSGVGLNLFENFNDDNSAFFLADYGYMSSLKDSVEEMETANHANEDSSEYFADEDELIKRADVGYGAEFVYLWDSAKGKWFYDTVDYKKTEFEFKELTFESFLSVLKENAEYFAEKASEHPEYAEYYKEKYDDFYEKAYN